MNTRDRLREIAHDLHLHAHTDGDIAFLALTFATHLDEHAAPPREEEPKPTPGEAAQEARAEQAEADRDRYKPCHDFALSLPPGRSFTEFGGNIDGRLHTLKRERDEAVERAEKCLAQAEKAERAEGEEKRGDLHAGINEAVSKALGQDFGESWHDLGEKVAAVVAAREKAEAELSETVDRMNVAEGDELASEEDAQRLARECDAAQARVAELEGKLRELRSQI